LFTFSCFIHTQAGRTEKDLTTGNDVVYLYDGWRRVRDYKLDGETWMPTREYVWGGTYIDELIAFTDDTHEDGDFEDAGGSERYLVCQQANYNVVAVVKASTVEVVEKITYDPYGQPDLEQVGAASPTGNTVLFQGREWDDDADLYYFRNRWYSPALGSFVQRDPMGYEDGMDLLSFETGQPLSQRDSFGAKVGDKCDHIMVKKLRFSLRKNQMGQWPVYGHWWIQIGPLSQQETYGWYPTYPIGLLWVEGQLNEGMEADPHHSNEAWNTPGLQQFHPNITMSGYLDGTDKHCACLSCEEAVECIRKIARSYKGTWWEVGFNCHKFVLMLLTRCCLDTEPVGYPTFATGLPDSPPLPGEPFPCPLERVAEPAQPRPE